MFEDSFGIMLSKFSDDARLEMRRRLHRQQQVRDQKILTERLHTLLKRTFLVIAVVGVGVGIYFARETGNMMGQLHYSGSAETDPTLRGIPAESAKRIRRMEELSRKHAADYEEVEQMLDATQ